jgi:type I restriction enzyme S subunit
MSSEPNGELNGSVRRWKRYSAYAASGTSWLDSIPAHWQVKRLKFVSTIQTGLTLGKDYAGRRLVTRPYLRVANVQDGYLDLEKITEVAVPVENVARHELRPGDVLMTEGGDYDKLGRGYVWEGQIKGCLHQNHIFAVRPRPSLLESRFLASLMTSWHGKNYFTTTSQQTTNLASTNSTKLKNFPLPLPPVEEQTAILAFLDRETTKIDALIAKKKRLIELLEEKRTALIKRAVTQGLDPDVPMKASGVEWLGRIPAHWQLKRLKHVTVYLRGIQMGPFGGMLKDLEQAPTPYKLYGQENTINNDFTAGARWLTKEHFDSLLDYELKPGDVVLTRKGASIGNCRVVPEGIRRGVIDSDTIRVRLDPSVIAVGFAVLLMHEGYMESAILSKQKGAVLPGLNTGTIENLHIALPPVREQEEILLHLTHVGGQILNLVARVREGIDKLGEYRTALISAVVTGQIDVRGEVASDGHL